MDELIALLQSDDACTVCRKERRTYLFEGEKVFMCLSCYAMKALKNLAPVEVEYIEYAYDTGGKAYKLNETRKWYRKFYKDILWDGKD